MKQFRVFFVLALFASILAACGNNAQSTSNATTAVAASAPATSGDAAASGSASGAAGSVAASANTCEAKGPKVDNLVFWTRSLQDAPDNDEYEYLQAVGAAYTEKTGSPVEVVTVPDADFKARMSIAAPAGEGPDVYGPIAHDWIGEFAIQGIAAEIPDTVIPNKADITQATLDAATVNGKLYGLPLFVESIALIYNKDLVPTAPTTWEEFTAAAQQVTQSGKQGFGFPLLEQYHEGAFWNGFGSYVFKYENGQFNTDDIGLNNAAGVETAKFLRDMYHQQKLVPDVAIDRANMHTVQEGEMEAGNIAMTFNGPWRETPLTNAGINYGVAKLPTLPNGQPMKPFIGVQVMAANSNSKNLDAALDFVQFATCTDSTVELYKAFKKAPARTSVLDSEVLKANPNIQVWNEQAKDGVPMPNIPAMSNVWKPWGDAMDAIIVQNAPDDQVQGILDTSVEQIKAAIQQTQGSTQ